MNRRRSTSASYYYLRSQNSIEPKDVNYKRIAGECVRWTLLRQNTICRNMAECTAEIEAPTQGHTANLIKFKLWAMTTCPMCCANGLHDPRILHYYFIRYPRNRTTFSGEKPFCPGWICSAALFWQLMNRWRPEHVYGIEERNEEFRKNTEGDALWWSLFRLYKRSG